jgi:hypothetical protein
MLRRGLSGSLGSAARQISAPHPVCCPGWALLTSCVAAGRYRPERGEVRAFTTAEAESVGFVPGRARERHDDGSDVAAMGSDAAGMLMAAPDLEASRRERRETTQLRRPAIAGS